MCGIVQFVGWGEERPDTREMSDGRDKGGRECRDGKHE